MYNMMFTVMAYVLSVLSMLLCSFQARHGNTGNCRHLLLEQQPVQRDASGRSDDDDVLNDSFCRTPEPERMPLR